MAELILGAVGVVPLIGIAFKSYRTLHSELKTFRHCSSNLKRFLKLLRIQRQLFENECQLLLRDCLGDELVVQDMVADPEHGSWSDPKRDESIKKLLKSNYEAFEELVGDILEAIQKLESGLACFQILKSMRQKGEKMRDTWERVRNGMALTFNRRDYESDLDKLRSANADLRSLREQVMQLQTPCKVVSIKRRGTSQRWSDIRRAAKAFHEALIGAWSCGQASHLRHFVKLFLEAEKADENVYMDIVIMCHGYGQDPGDDSLIQLQVRSGYVTWMQTPRPFVPASSGNERPNKRIKSVRFTEESSTTYTITSTPASTANCAVQPKVQDTSSDLRASGDFCSELITRCGQKHPPGTRCLGHLDVHSSDTLRHSFYPSHTITRGIYPSAGDVLGMDSFLQSTTNFSYVDRLKLARALVLAVLKFYDTPWLSDEWQLGDFSLFRAQDVSSALRTLHLGVEINRSAMEDVQLGQRLPEDELIYCGIENMALHSLGVALLQIERQETIDLKDVLAVRKAAKVPSRFGPRYQEITRKCLRCDFGFGVDLGKGELQRAVYERLVGELETMISALSIDDED
ncbi:uncharacterized protein B0H64DRAFT_349583 [Chaetomium fimeti]|uniref:DUF7580 domain-containing protein n=1 Tax=Chaetomium fimeti TaxID=1854472 RepID=A0AAE0LMP7_9PEZI|nr:hypothetical protein B0H64DRAFT_349583 [Chaetomium fimeti]